MQIVGGDGIPLKVVLTPQTDSDQRNLFNSKGKILESLRSRGIAIREVVVAGGVRR